MGGALPGSPSKKWPSVFSKNRDFKGTHPYVEKIKRGIDAAGDDIGILLEDVEKQVPTCKAEEVKEFCQGASREDLITGTITVTRRPDAWLDDKSYPSPMSRENKNPASATRLLALLKAPQFDEADIPVAHRRLIYIQNLDPYYILALLETASFSQVSLLRDAIWKHLAFQTSLRVRIPTRGYKTFHLELHLPYFAFRASPPPAGLHPQEVNSRPPRKWTDLSFLEIQGANPEGPVTCGMLEAHNSLVIWGTDNHRWAAYAFADTDFDDEALVDKIFPDEGFQLDPISETEAKFPIWDPREYFLKVFELRIAQVLEEWEGLVRPVERSIHGYRDRHSCTLSQLSGTQRYRGEDVKKTFDWTRQTMELLSRLLDGLSEIVMVWERFNSSNLDIGYFSDHEPLDEWQDHINLSLCAIHETFETLKGLHRTLRLLDKSCRDSAQVLQLRLTLESNEATQHTGVTSGLTGLIIAPIGLGMAFFSMRDGVVPFQLNFKSFVGVTLSMMIVMRLLFFIFRGTPGLPWWWKQITAWIKTLKVEGRACSLSIRGYGIRDSNHHDKNMGDVELGTVGV